MKKLMIALAAVACAVGVQAASVTWSSTKGASGNTFLVDGTGAQITALPAGTSIILVSLSGDDLAAYQAGTYTGTYNKDDVLNTAAINTSTKAAKKGQASGELGFVYAAGSNPISDGDVLAVLITDGKNTSNIKYYDSANGMVTDTFTVTGLDKKGEDPGDMNLYAGTFNFATKGNFVSEVQGVPEPTSGLLLLLGVAGLALRRRRA